MNNYMFRRAYSKILSSPKTNWRWPVQAETCSCSLCSH